MMRHFVICEGYLAWNDRTADKGERCGVLISIFKEAYLCYVYSLHNFENVDFEDKISI